nr:O-antigen polysaccharide polymerase Wzy family protein [Helcococcus sueciensis]
MNSINIQKKNIKNYSLKYILISTLFLILFILLSMVKNVNGIFFMTMLVFNVLLILSFKNYRKNIPLIMFLLCYFMFLLGSYFVYEYFEYAEGVVLFDNEILNHIYLSLLISLISVMIGYFTIDIRLKTRFKFAKNIDEEIVRKCSLLLFYLSYIPYIAIEILRVSKVREIGYTEFYLDDAVSIPYIIGLFIYGCMFYFYIYLSTLPEKNEAKLPLFLFMIYCTLTLFTGNRSVFVVNLSIIFIYSIFRSNNINSEDNWINKRLFFLIILLIPIMLLALDYLGSVRFNNTIFDQNKSASFLDIFVKQGVSSSVIGFEKINDYRIPNRIYSLGIIIEKIKYNPLSTILFGLEPFRGNSIDRAMLGNSFAHTISYIVLPFGYLHGRGLGTCYIAEAYHDFGYIGILIFSLVYGIILKRCSKFSSKNFIKRLMIIVVLSSLLMIPRSNADSFISVFLKNEFIFGIILIKILSNRFAKNSKK